MGFLASPNSSGSAQKKHSTSWWPFGTKKDEEELQKKESTR
jgi:hypothetical protein